MNTKKCCVCGRADKWVSDYKNTLTKESMPYCLDCWVAGREPYEVLVDYGWDFEMFTKSYQQKIIAPTLLFYNKTIDQFNEDINRRESENNATG
jgi:hypothetical protein